jgi:hypothetical protein
VRIMAKTDRISVLTNDKGLNEVRITMSDDDLMKFIKTMAIRIVEDFGDIPENLCDCGNIINGEANQMIHCCEECV